MVGQIKEVSPLLRTQSRIDVNKIESWILWQVSKEDWIRIKRGLEKTGVKFVIASGLLVSPEQPWLTMNLLMMLLALIFMSFFVYVGGVSMYYAQNDLTTFVEIAHAYTFVLAFWVLLSVHFVFKLPVLHELLQVVDADIFEYKNNCCKENEEKFKKQNRFYHLLFQTVLNAAILAAVLLLGFLAPAMIKLFEDENRRKVKEINYDFPVPLWFPFRTDNLFGFCFAYSLLMIEILLVAIYLAAAIPFLVYAAFEVNTQYRILKNSILNLEPRALEKYNCVCRVAESQIEMLRQDSFFEYCVQECIKENILHHIEILK
ncbi:hypothetical protein LSTR_LSTR003637 [Laodelphax striatellus]|uniref:Odorant receptor n=1 Tax=Laodelphax striatellus TaxID=195883 RepID=A0A482XCA6_LAOST|nr:hypothetical protein LSTR_LSTR003637 [Laodelphax striatellus]